MLACQAWMQNGPATCNPAPDAYVTIHKLTVLKRTGETLLHMNDQPSKELRVITQET